MTRPYLLYVACAKGKTEIELFGEGRQFDVAINDYTGNHETPAEAEYRFSQDQWKFQHVHALASLPSSLSPFLGDYRAVALFDDDIRVSTADLNRLFAVGDVFKLRLWQPALGEGSRATWPVTRRADGSLIRMTDFVEIMCPIFSREGLRTCLPTFTENVSGWSLDTVLWRGLLNRRGMAIVDAVPVGHYRPIGNGGRRLANGKTPLEEGQELIAKYRRYSEYRRRR